MSKRQYIDIGKVHAHFTFRIPFVDHDIDWCWEFILLKIAIHDLRKTDDN